MFNDSNVTIYGNPIFTVNNVHDGDLGERRRQPALTASPETYEPPILPPEPPLLIGRNHEKKTVVHTLCASAKSRVAILGQGGMGKTTLALSVLHNDSIRKSYPSRLFFSCETMETVRALVNEIADALQIPDEYRKKGIDKVVVARLGQLGQTLVCIDNLEALWEKFDSRKVVEDFLSMLDALPSLAILITLRGNQRPGRVSWAKPLLPALNRLTDKDSISICQAILGTVDDNTRTLIHELEGIPLTICLIASLLEEGNESSSSLLARWRRHGTRIVGIDGGLGGDSPSDRLHNLNKSIHLSVHSPRMQADPDAIQVLAMLALLPDGLIYTESTLDRLQAELPSNTDLRKNLVTLRQVSLVSLEVSSNPSSTSPDRLRMLSPIRQYCITHIQILPPYFDALIRSYLKLLLKCEGISHPTSYSSLVPELTNITTILLQAISSPRGGEYRDLPRGAEIYTKWSWYCGRPDPLPIRTVIDVLGHDPRTAEVGYRALGTFYCTQFQWSDARKCFKTLLSLPTATDLSKASALDHLGRADMGQNRLIEAEHCFRSSLDVYEHHHNLQGRASVSTMLGDLHRKRKEFSEARKHLNQALTLARRIKYTYCEASALLVLGWVEFDEGNLDKAEELWESVLALNKQIHTQDSTGDVLRGLGCLSTARHDWRRAEEYLQQALVLSRRMRNLQIEGLVVGALGDLHLAMGELSAAERYFQQALPCFRQIQDTGGEDHVMGRIQVVRTRRALARLP